MFRSILHLLIFIAPVMISCNDQPREKPQEITRSGRDTAQAEAYSDPAFNPPQFTAGFSYKFAGTIGNRSAVFYLDTIGGRISGVYFYDQDGVMYTLSGQAGKGDTVALEETDSRSKRLFRLLYRGIDSDSVTGSVEGAPVALKRVSKDSVAYSLKEHHRANCDLAGMRGDGDSLAHCNRVALSLLSVQANAGNSGKINSAIFASLSGNLKLSLRQLLHQLDDHDPEGGGEFQSIVCEAVTNEQGIFSYQIAKSHESFGGAHPSYELEYHNIDTKTGKPLLLEDLFLPGSKPELNKIGQRAYYSPREDTADMYQYEFDLDENFAIFPNGLLFQYVPPAFDCYAAGQPVFFIPFKKIEHLMRRDGILYRCGLLRP